MDIQVSDEARRAATNCKKVLLSIVGSCILIFCGSELSFASLTFEYELYIQAESSLDIGNIDIQGKIVNTGTVDISNSWGAIWGMPMNINQTTNSDAIHTIGSLSAGSTYYFSWLIGTQEEDLTSFAGKLLEGAVGFVPTNSDWYWSLGGCIPELSVSSLWVNGPANSSLPWNKVTINLQTANNYLVSPTPLTTPVPAPATIILLGSGLVGLAGFRKRLKKV